MKDYNLSRESFHELLENLTQFSVRILQKKLKFCTTKGLVSSKHQNFEFGEIFMRNLKWKEWLAICIVSWHVKDETLKSYLRYYLGQVYLGDYEFLKETLENKQSLINYLWESDFRTSLIFDLTNQIFHNANVKITFRPTLYKVPRRSRSIRRIGVGYKDQGSARIPSKKQFLPEDSRRIQHLLHVERLRREKEISDLRSFIRGFAALDGEFI